MQSIILRSPKSSGRMGNVSNIQDLMTNLTNTRASTREALDAEFVAGIKVRRELSKMLGALERAGGQVGIWAHEIEIGHWGCDFSPIEICVYDDYMDPVHDNCLYCNYPEERK